MAERLRVVVATPLDDELCRLLEEREPRLEVVVDQDLLPPMRWPGDHDGDPSFTRTPEQQARFRSLLDSAQALYGIPDTSPAELARTVRVNPNLRWVHTMAAGGAAQIRAAELSPDELGRVVWSVSAGPHAGTLAEFALFGVLAGAKDLPRLQRQREQTLWSDRWLMRAVFDMRVVVVGLGNIGRRCADVLLGLGATVVGVNRTPRELAYEVVGLDRLAEAVAGADAVVVTLPGASATEGLVDRAVLSDARPGLIVVNVGRGNVIDEPALVEALESGRVGFAALDVTAVEPLPADSPLWTLPNVVLSPHTAALHGDEDRLIAELFADNATRLLDGLPLHNAVEGAELT